MASSYMNSNMRPTTPAQNAAVIAAMYKHPLRSIVGPFGLGLRAGTAAGAVVMKPVFAIKPGRGKLGMTNAAPANEREMDGL